MNTRAGFLKFKANNNFQVNKTQVMARALINHQKNCMRKAFLKILNSQIKVNFSIKEEASIRLGAVLD